MIQQFLPNIGKFSQMSVSKDLLEKWNFEPMISGKLIQLILICTEKSKKILKNSSGRLFQKLMICQFYLKLSIMEQFSRKPSESSPENLKEPKYQLLENFSGKHPESCSGNLSMRVKTYYSKNFERSFKVNFFTKNLGFDVMMTSLIH